jgi:hypothetical protein
MANHRYPAKGTCYIASCKQSATTWIKRNELSGGEYRVIEAKVCNSHAKQYVKAKNQNG